MFKKLSKKKGFTLMEMMIVVAIIAILMAIIIPSFKGALDRANIATDEANLRAYYAEQMANAILDDKNPTESTKLESFTVSGVEYTLKGGTASSKVNSDGQLIITYKPKSGKEVTIPGTSTSKTNSGTGSGSADKSGT